MAGVGRENEIPPGLRKLRTPAYLRMLNQILDDDAGTTICGACAIGILEAEMWTNFQTVPTRDQLLAVRRCPTMESAVLMANAVAELYGKSR